MDADQVGGARESREEQRSQMGMGPLLGSPLRTDLLFIKMTETEAGLQRVGMRGLDKGCLRRSGNGGGKNEDVYLLL